MSTEAPDEITRLVCRVVQALAPEDLGRDTTLFDALINDLGYDSLSLMELAFALEESFELDPMSAEDSLGIEKVEQVCSYVVREIAQGRGQVPSSETLKAALEELS